MENRINDILVIVINISSLIMLYGISNSIKSSVDRQAREELILYTLSDLISCEVSSRSDESSDENSLDE